MKLGRKYIVSPGIIFLFLLLTMGLFSCNVSEKEVPNVKSITKIFSYDINKDSSQFIKEGYSELLLPKSKRLLYFYSGDDGISQIWLYDYSAGENILLLNNFYAYLDDYSVSPDETNIVYVNGKVLSRLYLNSGYIENLTNSTDYLVPPARYSGDGHRIIYFAEKNQSDSLYVNIYDFADQNDIILDTVFVRDNDKLNVYFTNDSQKFYVLREGWNGTGYWEIQFNIYNNTHEPEFFNRRSHILTDYDNSVFNIADDKILIMEKNKIVQYDLSEDTFSREITYQRFGYWIKKIKNYDRLISISLSGSIGILNYDGVTKQEFNPGAEDTIEWTDFAADDSLIFYGTTRNIYY